MTPTELQALAILTGVPRALYQGRVYIQTNRMFHGGLLQACSGCAFTNDKGAATSACVHFRNKNHVQLFGTEQPHMCDREFTSVADPVWVLANDEE